MHRFKMWTTAALGSALGLVAGCTIYFSEGDHADPPGDDDAYYFDAGEQPWTDADPGDIDWPDASPNGTADADFGEPNVADADIDAAHVGDAAPPAWPDAAPINTGGDAGGCN